jgi:MFS family permease
VNYPILPALTMKESLARMPLMASDSPPVVSQSRRIFFGWWTVLVTGVVSGLGHGFYQYGISVFFKDIASELGLSRAITSLATGIGRLEGGIFAPVSGWLSDRFGPKWVTFTGICIAVIGLALMNFVTSEWTYFVAWGVLTGLGLNLGLTVTIDKTLTNWFVRQRGLAMGIKFALIGVGGVVVLPIVTWLVAMVGWRMTCLIWSAIMLACTPPMLIFIKQKRPEYYGLLPDGARAGMGTESDKADIVGQGVAYASSFQETEFTFKQAIRTRAYWMISIAFAIFALVYGGFTIHIIPFLTDIGMSTTAASGLMGMMVFFTIPSRFLGGVLADRVRKGHLQFLLAGGFFLQAIGIGTFLLSQNTASVYILLILYGFSGGVVTPLVIVILGRYFGRKDFGAIFGTCMLLHAPPSLLAPVYAGWIYDTTGSYTTALVLFAALAAVSAFAVCLVSPPKIPGNI